jgi:hypothetical protein
VSVNDVLSYARLDIGLGEYPPGSNHNRTTEWYLTNVDPKLGTNRFAWCEASATKWMWTGGAKSLKRGRAYTVWAANDFVAGVNGSSWHWGTGGILPGDQVYFDWAGRKGSTAVIDHTGLVESVNADGTFYTIEGNIGDACRRMLRDSKYVVGYGRFAWSRLVPPPKPKPRPPASSIPKLPTGRPNPRTVRKLQGLLEVKVDGQWGPTTDQWAMRLRAAARSHVGYPRNTPVAFRHDLVQRVIDTTPDNVWGPKSQAALIRWVKDAQRLLGVTADGEWGPKTDAQYLALRKANLNRF